MNTTQTELQQLIKELEKDKLEESIVKRINQLFFSYDQIKPNEIDSILVLSSSSMKRIQKAVEIYKKQKCTLFLSGGSYHSKDKMKESERYYLYAITHGVLEEDIQLELSSQNTKENFIYTLPLLKTKKHCLLVTSSQHMPRALLTAERVKQEQQRKNITFYPCPSYATLVPKETWQCQKQAKEIIRGEAKRLIKYNLIKK